MTMTSGTYRPVSAHQPRGGRPWCATCHTDKHLSAGSATVLDARGNTLAVAVTCSRCGGSRVLETTEAFAAALAPGAKTRGGHERNALPLHCKEPMALVDLAARDFGFSGPAAHLPDAAQPRVLRCRCGFQMDAPDATPRPGRSEQRTP